MFCPYITYISNKIFLCYRYAILFIQLSFWRDHISAVQFVFLICWRGYTYIGMEYMYVSSVCECRDESLVYRAYRNEHCRVFSWLFLNSSSYRCSIITWPYVACYLLTRICPSTLPYCRYSRELPDIFPRSFQDSRVWLCLLYCHRQYLRVITWICVDFFFQYSYIVTDWART